MEKRFLKATLASALSLVLAVTPALAAANAGNSETGANSENEATVTTRRVVTIKNTNSSSVTNTVSSWVNSGSNSASYNTGSGTISTGKAKWGSALKTSANCSETRLEMDTGGDPTATNNNTGAVSVNDAYVEISNEVNLTNENGSEIINAMEVQVDSGFNLADYNTGSGSVTTGDAEGSASVESETNANTAYIAGSVDGEHSASNDTTGYDSENDAGVEIANSTGFYNWNDSFIDNYLDLWVDSGDNSASYNTGDGTVDTGDADAGSGLEILNLANGNFATIEGGVGETVGSASNDTTGAESENDAYVGVTNVVDLENENWGYISNRVIASAISGWNLADYNTGNASVETDDSSMEVGVGNVLNTNQSSVGSEEPLSSSGTASNEWTGDDSYNEATVETYNELSVDNVNNDEFSGGVSNAVTADALSGYNSGSYNTGNSDIDTGKSDVEVGLATDENSNLTLFAGFGPNNDSMWNRYTGYSSGNYADVVHDEIVTVEVDNWGWIANIFDDEANSGMNLADYNTGNSSVVTDDAGLIESTDDSMNYNFFGWPSP